MRRLTSGCDPRLPNIAIVHNREPRALPSILFLLTLFGAEERQHLYMGKRSDKWRNPGVQEHVQATQDL